MATARAYCPPGILGEGVELTLDADASRHLLLGLRLAVGAPVELFDGSGGAWRGRLVAARRGEAVVRAEGFLPGDRLPARPVWLAQAILPHDAMDWLIQKATELGVAVIVPLITRYGVVRLDARRAEKRQQHWQAVARAASIQCGRNRLPDVLAPQALDRWLAAGGTNALCLFGQPGAPGPAVREASPPAQRVHVLAGPEGGLHRDEQRMLEGAGYIGWNLGPRILRAETAGMLLVARAVERWGGEPDHGP